MKFSLEKNPVCFEKNPVFFEKNPVSIRFIFFVFFSFIIYSGIIFFVYFVPAALERSTPAQPAADEEESQGEEQGGQAKGEQLEGGKSDARWQQRYELSGSQAELETRVREILCNRHLRFISFGFCTLFIYS